MRAFELSCFSCFLFHRSTSFMQQPTNNGSQMDFPFYYNYSYLQDKTKQADRHIFTSLFLPKCQISIHKSTCVCQDVSVCVLVYAGFCVHEFIILVDDLHKLWLPPTTKQKITETILNIKLCLFVFCAVRLPSAFGWQQTQQHILFAARNTSRKTLCLLLLLMTSTRGRENYDADC